MARIEVSEFKCDVCGKVIREERSPIKIPTNPLREVEIPMKNYDCEGRNFSKGFGVADMCKDCVENYWNYVQKRYDASDYFGITLKGE